MINLIPPEGRTSLKREYALRVGATLAFLFGIVFILLTAALIPTHVLINAQINAYKLEAEREQDSASFAEADIEVRKAADIVAQLKTSPSTPKASAVIDEVQKRATPSITFKTFYVMDTQGVIEKIQVQGTAPTREALATLRSSIEASDMFENAEVPIADLARDADLPFAITVTLSKTP